MTPVVSPIGQRRFLLGGEVTVIVYVAVLPATAPVPGETAVNTHCPGPSTVKVVPPITHGPVSLSRTVAPEAAVALSAVLEPACRVIGRPGFHGAPAAGVTVMESLVRAGWMFTAWLEVPLKEPFELENSALMVCTPESGGVHVAATPPVLSVGVEPIMP